MKKVFAVFTLAALIAAALSGCAKQQRLGSSDSEADMSVDTGAAYYKGSTEGDTFLTGLDGQKIKVSEITYLKDKNYEPTNILDENDFGAAVCGGFVYAFKPGVCVNENVSPEMFENGVYIGESPETSSEYFRVNAGDKFGDLIVKSASCTFGAALLNGEEYLGYTGGELEFEGEITLTGELEIPTPLTEAYGGMIREMKFYGDLENGIPLSLECLYNPRCGFGICHSAGGEYKRFTDIPQLDLGKITDYDLDFGGLSHGDTARVKITVSGLRLTGQLDNICFAFAELVDIKRL